jgi:hypothetical protein
MNGSTPFHLAFDLGSEAALLAGDEGLELVIRLRISNFVDQHTGSLVTAYFA